jgi:hypothetical protein
MSSPVEFVRAVFKHWGALVTSGAVIGALGIWQGTGHFIPHWVYWLVAAVGLVAACYKAWNEERQNVVNLTERLNVFERTIQPMLHMDARVGRPDSEKTRWRKGAAAYYFRLAVTNTGTATARDVQVVLAGVEQLRLDKTYETVKRFSPANLVWEHAGGITKPVLLPKMPSAYCDLGHIADPAKKEITLENLADVAPNETILGLDVAVKQFPNGHLLGPGTYRFALKLGASNCDSQDYLLEVVVKGTWFEDENKMFREGFGMRLL